MTKRELLAQIRAKLNSQGFERVTDNRLSPLEQREIDVMHAGDAVLRENGYDPTSDYHAGRIVRDATGYQTGYKPGELQEAIDTFTAKRASVVTGNRVSRTTSLAYRVTVQNGQETLPSEAKIKFEKRTYTVATHATHPARRKSEPRWSRSELDLRLTIRNLETFWGEMTPRVRVFQALYLPYDPRGAADIMAGFGTPDNSPLALIAKSRRDVAQNQAEAEAVAKMLKANRDEIKRESAPVVLAHPSVRPDLVSVGTRKRSLFVRPKWFQVSPVPVSAVA